LVIVFNGRPDRSVERAPPGQISGEGAVGRDRGLPTVTERDRGHAITARRDRGQGEGKRKINI
jgi:hypothetical protein